ncbi:MAG: hypothetical protein PWR27_2442 [Petroclostridium sp.]|jgi:hypothetical protein|nr:hypothetical protein [Clostridia bacterium]MDK2811733.1 hypothetical protein [Petroclostridium sp.]
MILAVISGLIVAVFSIRWIVMHKTKYWTGEESPRDQADINFWICMIGFFIFIISLLNIYCHY